MRAAFRLLPLAAFICAASFATAQEQDVPLARYYGFTGIEIFKLEFRSANMIKGDFDSDGLVDVLLVDNSHSRLDLLRQRREGEPEKPSRVNDIRSDWRFEHVKIPVDRQVATLCRGDLNNDGRDDIAYLGLPDRLIVRYQSENQKQSWAERFTIRLPDIQPTQWMMATGDLNGDDRDDLVVLGKTATYLLYQNDSGKLDPPVSLMNTSTQLALVQVADLDGDGRDDLTYLSTEENTRGLCARLQLPNGELGPELRFDLNRPRAVTLFNVDETPATEILTIDIRTGRVSVSRLGQPEVKPGELAARLTQYGFGEEGSGKDRDLDVGDIDGDGLPDVVVTDPEKARMLVYRQQKDRGLSQAESYPGLLGANHVRVADLDGDGRTEVVVSSPREKVIAMSRFQDGRLTFPRSLPGATDVEPVCFDVADLDGDGSQDVIHISKQGTGRSAKSVVGALTLRDGKWDSLSIGSEQNAAIDFDGKPEHVQAVDANTDGRTDLLVFFDLNKPPALLIGKPDNSFEQLKPDGGIQLGKLERGNVAISSDGDKTELLVAQEGFARRILLENSQWQVLDQYNAAEAGAEVAGSAELNLDGEAGNEIVLIDTGVKKLRVLRKDANVFRAWREVELGSLDYQTSRVRDLNGDGKNDLLLVGKGQFAVLYAEQTDPELEEVASFETKLDKVFFSDLIAGDLNGDGRPDIALMDTRSHYVEVLSFDPARGLQHALSFKVFEEKSFSADRTRSGSEPREGIIADVTGDGRSDLLLLAHDRVLLYPQDTGEEPVAGSASESANQ